MTLTAKLPATPEIRMMAIVAEIDYNLRRPPSSSELVHVHITNARRRGLDFAPWTAEGAQAFLARRSTP